MATNKASPSRPSAAEIREEIRFWRKKLYEIEGGQGSAGDQGSVGNQGSVGSVGGHGSVGSVGGSAGYPIDVDEEEWRLDEADPTAPYDEATIKFPSGISSMRQWGLTLIEHGQSATYKNKSYVDVAASTDPRDLRYKKWIKAYPTRNPCIIDFVAYLRYYDLLHPKAEVTFPGSKTIRRFAPGATQGEHCTRS